MFKFESKEVVEIETAIERVDTLIGEIDVDAISKVANRLREKLVAAKYKEALMRLPILRKACASLVQEGIISRDSVPGDVDLIEWEDGQQDLRVEFQDDYPGIDEITIDLNKNRWQLWQYDCQLDPDEQEGYVSDWKD